jgi:hypothetical protein
MLESKLSFFLNFSCKGVEFGALLNFRLPELPINILEFLPEFSKLRIRLPPDLNPWPLAPDSDPKSPAFSPLAEPVR